MAKRSGKFVVEATVCDVIRSVPVDKKQAGKMSRLTKSKIPKAKIKIRKA